MPRPKKPRFISSHSAVPGFAPLGVPANGEIIMTLEALEAIRLSDFEHLDQERAAILMEVSRHTFGRILAEARSAIAEALFTGKLLKIEGGTYEVRGMGRGKNRKTTP